MLLLTSILDELRIFTADATPLEVHASWVDNATGSITPGRTNTLISSATTTTVVDSPASGAQRNVKMLSICNPDPADACLFAVLHTDGVASVRLIEVDLDPASSLVWIEGGDGWEIVPKTLAGVDVTGLATAASVVAVASTAASATAAAIVTAEAYADAGDATLTSALALKAPLASPTFTGVPAAPTASAATNTTQVATTAFVHGEIAAIGLVDLTSGVTGVLPAANMAVVAAAAGTLTGATLAAGVTASSLTSVGTLANLTVTNPITGSVTGSAASATGNAATATKFAATKQINTVAFDGSADITVTAAAGTLTGATLAANVLASSLTSTGTLATLTVTGAVGVGGAANSADKVSLSGTAVTGIGAYGVNVRLAAATSNTTHFTSFSSIPSTPNSAFTIADLTHVRLNNTTKGAASTITAQYGIRVADLAAGTSNFAYHTDISAGSLKWGFYAAGTAANYFAGQVAIGSATLDTTAALAITSTTQGLLPPRLTTTQRDAITSPTPGLLIYNSTTGKMNFRGASAWEAITSV